MKKLKDLFNKANVAKAAVFAGALTGASVAHADLPAVVGTTFTSLQTDGSAMAELAWPVVGTIFAAGLLFKLFKRFGNKI